MILTRSRNPHCRRTQSKTTSAVCLWFVITNSSFLDLNCTLLRISLGRGYPSPATCGIFAAGDVRFTTAGASATGASRRCLAARSKKGAGSNKAAAGRALGEAMYLSSSSEMTRLGYSEELAGVPYQVPRITLWHVQAVDVMVVVEPP